MNKLYEKLNKEAYDKAVLRIDNMDHMIEGTPRRKMIDHAINREFHLLICEEIEKRQAINPDKLLENLEHHLGLLRDSEKQGTFLIQAMKSVLLLAKCIIQNSIYSPQDKVVKE